MPSYTYTVEAGSERTGHYLASLMRLHGLVYDWKIQTCAQLDVNDIRLIVQSHGHSHSSSSAELLFTDSPVLLNSYGIYVGTHSGSAATHIELLDSELGHFVALPIWWPAPLSVATFSDEWNICAQLIDAAGNTLPILIQHSQERLVFCGALMTLLDVVTLGPHVAPGTFEDWAEALGIAVSQSVALECPLEQLLRFIRDTFTQLIPEAFPAVVDYFPPNCSAPLLLTGDTDDATERQLADFLGAIERARANASLLVRSFARYPSELIRGAAERGHGIGLHPYSEDASQECFQRDFQDLKRDRNALVCGRIGGVRNHRFQWIARSESVRLEREAEVAFDLNCVAASGRTWLGNSSGLAFPIPFVPLDEERFTFVPLHLPTSIEDDVYLYNYDYCYRPYVHGDSLAEDLLTSFLDEWLLHRGWPLVANLHPEHVYAPRNYVMRALLDWASTAGIWMPTLESFCDWIEARLAFRIDVVGQYSIRVTASRPIAVQASHGLRMLGIPLHVVESESGKAPSPVETGRPYPQ